MAGFAISWQIVTPWWWHTDTCAEAELPWVSGFTSTNGFLSTWYQQVETRTTSVTLSLLNTHITLDCVHILRPWWISFTPNSSPPPTLVLLSRLNYTSLFLLSPSLSPSAFTQSAQLVRLLCVLAGHTEELWSNQSQISVGWNPRAVCCWPITHTCTHTHTETNLQKVIFFFYYVFSIHHCFARKDHGKCGFAETLWWKDWLLGYTVV